MKFVRVKRYKGGALGKMASAINSMQESMERIRAGYGILFFHENNSIAITLDSVASEGGSSSFYNSYFRVINDGGNIGVTDGGSVVSGICGTVKINGVPVPVDAVSFSKSAGSHYVWLHSWITSSGPDAEIIVGTATRPNNPNIGIAFGSQLRGRVVIDAEGNLTITQDYLRGGEHTEILIGDCEGGAIA